MRELFKKSKHEACKSEEVTKPNSKNQTTHQLFFKIGIHTTVAGSVADATDQYFWKLVPMCAENVWLYSMDVSMAVYSSSASIWF